MSDNPQKIRPQDSDRINVNQQYEVDHWCKVLLCSESQLRAAVRAVGPMVKDVKKYLGK